MLSAVYLPAMHAKGTSMTEQEARSHLMIHHQGREADNIICALSDYITVSIGPTNAEYKLTAPALACLSTMSVVSIPSLNPAFQLAQFVPGSAVNCMLYK